MSGNETSIVSDYRTIQINCNNVPSKNQFHCNRISTNKYTLWNFVPKNLYEQFRRLTNFYFLITIIISLLIDSPISPWTSALPLSFVIFVTACKQGYEDFLRYKCDQRVNLTSIEAVRNNCLQKIFCQEIIVGDLLKINRNEDVPCDLVLLHSSETSGYCYITTTNLDGENNLKTLHVPKMLSSCNMADIVGLKAVVTCEHPQADLYSFHGKLEVNMESETISRTLTIDNVLLRGSRLKDTDYVIGCCIYSGQDTKLSLNSKQVVNKFSTAEKSINRYLMVFIALLIVTSLISVLLQQIFNYNSKWMIYLGVDKSKKFYQILISILNFMLLFNYIVPISLYVTVEMQKFLGSLFFTWDREMYDKVTDQAPLSNTSDLNEELGQVEYLFTDKTGTLTENLMVFKRCYVNGNVYMERDCDGYLYLLPPSGNDNEAVKLTSWHSVLWHFWLSISLCHTVHIASPSQTANAIKKRTEYRDSFKMKKITRVHSSLLMHPSLPEYQATSADEKSLVEASARCGIVLLSDFEDKIEIKAKDQRLTFKRLETLEFTSERRRMSVIVQDSSNDIWLYCKGADSSILPLIVETDVDEVSAQVFDFSMRGYRTLVIGYKKLDTLEYEELMRNVENAREKIGDRRKDDISEAYNLFEKGLTLLGVTAVEDRLQDDVPHTMESLKAANIKIWVLTGDKAETAENIAFHSGHFKKGTEVLRLMKETSVQSCFATLIHIERKIKLEPLANYGLLIDGSSMAFAITHFPSLLRNVSQSCEAVVCCRMSPLQKSEIVHLIKNSKEKPITAAIGDGGNDVSMIKEAHIGIGIMGKEGRQATMSADFAFAKFKFLRKALLVHGHWYYIRISNLIQYFFYKNVVFVTPQFLFEIHNGFSGQALYHSFFMMGYNVLFTSLPVLMYGLLEQNYSAKTLLHSPQLYILHRKNSLLSIKQFLVWFLTGIWQGCAIYFLCHFYWIINPVILHDSTSADHWTFSTCIFYIVVLTTNVQILLHSCYWSTLFVSSIVLSEAVFYIAVFIYCSVFLNYDGKIYWVFHKLTMSPTFWLLTVLALVICLVPDLLIVVYNTYRPLKLKSKFNLSEQSRINNGFVSSTTDIPLQTRNNNVNRLLRWKGNFSINNNA